MKKAVSELSCGDHFWYGGYEWAVLDDAIEWLDPSVEVEAVGVLAITAESVSRSVFDSGGSNNWKESSIRKELNNIFYEGLKENGEPDYDLHNYAIDIVADDGLEDYGFSVDKVFLLTCDMYRKYRKYIPDHKYPFYTCTPNTCCDDPLRATVRYVNNNGTVGNVGVKHAVLDIVPVCVFKQMTKVDVPDKENDCSDDNVCSAKKEIETVLAKYSEDVSGTAIYELLHKYLGLSSGRLAGGIE